jgi:hypothetical protein
MKIYLFYNRVDDGDILVTSGKKGFAVYSLTVPKDQAGSTLTFFGK